MHVSINKQVLSLQDVFSFEVSPPSTRSCVTGNILPAS